MVNNDNVIVPLDQSLQHIKQSITFKEGRLREIEREADGLRGEIDALQNSAVEIKKIMRSLIDGKQSGKQSHNRSHEMDMELSDYDDLYDTEEDSMPRYQTPKRTNNNYEMNNYPPPQQQRSVVSMHRNNSNHSGKQDIPTTNPEVEVRSYRFRERTITQACSVLMREAGRPLHVNEIYNRLLESGMNFTGNNPTISIAVSLNRNHRFRRVAPGTFDLNIRDASQAAS